MKKFQPCLILVCLSVVAFAQNEPYVNPAIKIFIQTNELLLPEKIAPKQLALRTSPLQPITETYWQPFQLTDSLIKTVRYLNTYDPSGALIKSIYQKLENGIWKDETSIILVYNSRHQLITQQFESWISHSWIPTYRNIHFYSDDKSLSEKILQAWEEEKWINVSRKQIESDSSLQTTTETNQYWVNNEWINNNRVVRQYNICEMLKTRLFQTWVNGGWINDIRETYSYGQHRLPGKVVSSKWVHEDWKETGAYHYTYDLNKNQTSISYYNVNPLEWDKDFKWSYDYNESNQLVRESFSTGSIDQWENFMQNIYTYSAGNKISLMSQVWEGQWRDQEYIEYNYKEVIDSFAIVNGQDLFLYPNPVNDELHVRLPDNIECPCTFSISGIDGKIYPLKSTHDTGHLTFPASQLVPGLYHFNFGSQNLQLSGSFVKQ